MRAFIVSLIAVSTLGAQGFPEAMISNGQVDAKLYLPDPARGYYRGTRFDWSGVIASLKYKGHEYVGVWFDKYDPKLHDAILGPVEEFRTNEAGLGFDEAKAGDTFVRIGVGAVRRPDMAPYQLFKTYDIVDGGKWTTKPGKDRVEFIHELKDTNGYGYIYKKTVRLEKGKPVMVLEHSLKNTGRKAIETVQYNHNFFVFDGLYSGPGTTVKFAFEPKAARELKGFVAFDGKEIKYLKQMEKGESVFTEVSGYGGSASDYDMRIEHAKAGTGVRITGDQPISSMNFWSIRTTVCPEPYIQLRVEPGSEKKWNIRYELYTLK